MWTRDEGEGTGLPRRVTMKGTVVVVDVDDDDDDETKRDRGRQNRERGGREKTRAGPATTVEV